MGINLTHGIFYSLSTLKKAMVADWGWTNTEASLPYTVCIAVLAFVTIFGGRLQDKYGPRIDGFVAEKSVTSYSRNLLHIIVTLVTFIKH